MEDIEKNIKAIEEEKKEYLEDENPKDLKTFKDLDNSYTRGPGSNPCNPEIFNGPGSNPCNPIRIPEKLMIFIDGENLFNALKDYKIKIDFQKLVNLLSRDFNLTRVYYYTGVPTRKNWDKNKETKKEFNDKLNRQMRFLENLEFNYNFHVVKKPLSFKGKVMREKGVDVNIASDIIWHGLSNNYDSFILISGDKDLMDCLIRMKDNGKKVMVANFENRISREIKRIADKYINLSDYIEEIRRD